MLHLICALKCEADPLIEHYRLQLASNRDFFTCYFNSKINISLSISNPGKQNAAAATRFTCKYFNSRKFDAWLNIGIAGHGYRKIGTAILAHKIEDKAQGKTWFPQFVFPAPCPTDSLRTLDKPSTEYENIMFDMEASGFYSEASRIGTAELIHVLKIISDNSENPVHKPDKKFFSSLIQQQISTIDSFVQCLLSLSLDMESLQVTSPFFDSCLKQWHFSQYEQHVLKRILECWHILRNGEDPIKNSGFIRNGKDLIKHLEKELDNTSIYY